MMKTFSMINLKNVRLNSIFKTQSLKFFSNDSSVIKFKFVYMADGKEVPAEGQAGESIMEVGKRYNVDWGVCGGNAACGTCHSVFPEEIYEKLPPASADEADLLDITQGLTETSRLGCQIKLSNLLQGASIQIPKATKNIYEGGKAPTKATFLHS